MSMRKHKYISGGYISQIGEGSGGMEISDAEYQRLMALLQARPEEPAGKIYRLREDEEWELCDADARPEPDPEAEISSAEAMEIITGGDGA